MEGRHSTLTVAANTGDIADYVSGVHARGSELAQAGAYLHWYSKYGVEKHEVKPPDTAFVRDVMGYPLAPST